MTSEFLAKEEKNVVSWEHLIHLNRRIKTIELLKNINNYKELGIKEVTEVYISRNNLLNLNLNPLQNELLKYFKCKLMTTHRFPVTE